MSRLARGAGHRRPRGIGQGIAFALAEAGFDLVLNDLERDADAERRSPGSRERGGQRRVHRRRHRRSRRACRSWSTTAFAPSAGSTAWSTTPASSVLSRGDLLDVAVESYDRCLDVNLRGPFFLTQAVARRMVEQAPRRGWPPRSIVTITSVNAEIASLSRGEYCISKAGAVDADPAVRAAPRAARHRRSRGAPGHHPHRDDRACGGALRAEIARGLTPIARWGEPADVGRAVATLATGGLPFSVGQVVYVDGGLSQARV